MHTGLVVTLILVIGGGLLVAAALADRRNRRVDRPRRPGLAAAPGNEPDYYTTDQLLAGAPQPQSLDKANRQRLDDRLAAAARLDLVLAAPTLATHDRGRAILDRPLILVCADQVNQLREVLPSMGMAAQDRRALLIAAPAIAADTLQTIAANKLAGTLEVAVALGQPAELAKLAAAAGTETYPVADRQAGLPRGTELGHVTEIVLDDKVLWIIDGRPGGPNPDPAGTGAPGKA